MCVCNSCGQQKILNTTAIKNNKTCGCQRTKSRSGNYNWTGHQEIHGKWWGDVKRGAKNRKHDFEIKIEDMWDLFLKQERKCALSGVPIKFSQTTRSWIETTASIDRIDSEKGYIMSNVQWVHKTVNLMKQSMSQNDFINMCHKISKHNTLSSQQLE